jgi:Family of unknown function (DUF6847)
MKLAEALILRADAQKRLEQLKQRLVRNAKVQEGDPPAEDPTALLAELARLSDELVLLIQRINKTNTATMLRAGVTIADALAVRDVLALKVGTLRELTQAAAITHDRFSKSEVKFRSTVNVTDLQKQIDQLAKEHRELDAQIQATNWQTDLVE